MTSLKKFFVLSAALALALVGGGTAQAQDFCSVSALNSGVTVRSEGITELTDEILVSCFRGTVDAFEDFNVTLDVNGGVPITNTIDNTDDKNVDDVVLSMYAEDGNLSTIPAVATDTGTLISDSSVRFVFDRPAVPSDGKFRMVIRGLRINAWAAEGDNVTATVAATGAPILGDATAIIARPAAGLKTKRDGGPVEGVSCAKSTVIGSGDLDGNDNWTTAELRVEEGFASAFLSNEVAGEEPGTRLLLSFEDIPAGVDVWLRPGHTAESNEFTCNDNTLTLHLLTDLDRDGFGIGEKAIPEDADNNYVQVPLAAGAGTAVYEVVESDDGTTEKCDIPVTFTWGDSVSLGTGTMSARFAPVSEKMNASVDSPLIPGGVRFVETGSSSVEAITIENCSTTLLFPFVTNQAGHDTGIAISNTSEDAFGTAAHDGSCTIYYHGSTEDGGAAPSEQTSGTIAAGEQLVFLVSAEAPGFQGYLMARCEFQFGHGLAFLNNGAGGVPTYAQSYLALVVPVQHGDRGVAAGAHEMLGQ